MHEAAATVAPPPPATHSPGVGNLSGLVLVMAVSAGLLSIAYRHFAKMQKRSSMHHTGGKMRIRPNAAASKKPS